MEELERLKRHVADLIKAPMLQKAAAAEAALQSALHCVGVLEARLTALEEAQRRSLPL